MQKSIFYTATLLIVLVTGTVGCANITSSQAVKHYNKGVDLMNTGQYDAAIAEYSQALGIDQNCMNAWVNRGYCYYMKKQYPMAIADYSQGINLNPKDTHAYNGRGASYLMLKQYENALEDFNQAIKLDPNFAKAIENRDYVLKILASSGSSGSGVSGDGIGGGGTVIETLTGEWVSHGSNVMFEQANYFYYDIVLSVVEDSSGNLKGTWTQTLLRTTVQMSGVTWPIGIPDKQPITGRRTGEDVQLTYGGQVVRLKLTGDSLWGEQHYYDYGSPVGGTPTFYEELHPELGSSYIYWTYRVNLYRK